jgi:hypothetical protein
MPTKKTKKRQVKGAPAKEYAHAPKAKTKKTNAAQKFYGSYAGY